MTFDWSVVWQHRDALIAGTATTILLTVATMVIAVPCGIIVAILRLYGWAPVRALAGDRLGKEPMKRAPRPVLDLGILYREFHCLARPRLEELARD